MRGVWRTRRVRVDARQLVAWMDASSDARCPLHADACSSKATAVRNAAPARRCLLLLAALITRVRRRSAERGAVWGGGAWAGGHGLCGCQCMRLDGARGARTRAHRPHRLCITTEAPRRLESIELEGALPRVAQGLCGLCGVGGQFAPVVAYGGLVVAPALCVVCLATDSASPASFHARSRSVPPSSKASSSRSRF